MSLKIKSLLLLLATFFMTGWWGPLTFLDAVTNPVNSIPGTENWVQEEVTSLSSQASNLNRHVLELGLRAYLKARQDGLDKKAMLTIIDYSRPSTERRLFVIDLKN